MFKEGLIICFKDEESFKESGLCNNRGFNNVERKK